MSDTQGPEQHLRLAVKKELRKRMRGVRGALPASAVAERSAQIARSLEALPAWGAARSVALFWPIEGRNEVDLRELCARALAQGKRLSFPWADVEAGEVRLKSVERLDEIAPGPMGFDEPPPGAPVLARGEVDVVVVPALAIDTRGHRIGYGKGFYDRMLPAYVPPALAVGVAFDFQLIAEVPTTEGDFALGRVVTDLQSFAPGEGGEAGEAGEADAGPVARGDEAAADESAGVKTVARPSGGAGRWKPSGPRSSG